MNLIIQRHTIIEIKVQNSEFTTKNCFYFCIYERE